MEQSGRNRWQPVANRAAPSAAEIAKTVAEVCDRLRPGPHGKEGVDGSSPSEGLKIPANQRCLLSVLNRG